jgi:predicted TIM-barrel fold metal-dependent hydrolase
MRIDFHTHVFPPFFGDNPTRFFAREPAFKALYDFPKSRLISTENLLKSMDEEGIDKSVIFGFPWDEVDHFRRHNDYIIESVQRYPDRVVGFCCFSPLSSQSAEEAQRCLAGGLAGVGELALYQSGLTSDVLERLDVLMSLCAGLNVPVLFHANEPVGHAYPGKTPMELSEIYRLVKRYPSNCIVLAHWGGGLFFYALMKKEVRDALRNVWFDTAASPYLYTPEVYRVAADIVGPDKILFASDYPLLSPKRYFQDMKSSGISEEAIRKISGENAARLLRL